MPRNSITKARAKPKRAASTKAPVGRPRRAPGLARRQFVVDTGLLETAMRLTGKNQSETVNDALAEMAQTAHIVDGLRSIRGMFPDFPDLEGEG